MSGVTVNCCRGGLWRQRRSVAAEKVCGAERVCGAEKLCGAEKVCGTEGCQGLYMSVQNGRYKTDAGAV